MLRRAVLAAVKWDENVAVTQLHVSAGDGSSLAGLCDAQLSERPRSTYLMVRKCFYLRAVLLSDVRSSDKQLGLRWLCAVQDTEVKPA